MYFIDVDDNIKLKLLTKLDTCEFYELTKKNMKHLEHYMPRIKEHKCISDTENIIELFQGQLQSHNGFRSGIVYNSKLVGITGLKYIDWYNSKTEIMYWIDYDFLGKGISTKCVNKVIEIAFELYGLNKVSIKSSIENYSSIRVAEKCGFSLEGTCKEEERLSNYYTDIQVYGLLRKDYIRRKQL